MLRPQSLLSPRVVRLTYCQLRQASSQKQVNKCQNDIMVISAPNKNTTELALDLICQNGVDQITGLTGRTIYPIPPQYHYNIY